MMITNNLGILFAQDENPELEELLKQADILYNQSKLKDAIKYYDKALDLDPKNVKALYNKGLSLDNLGTYKEAITYYDKVLAIDPNDIAALNNKGAALDDLGRYEEAITYYDKALAIDPNDVYALNNKIAALGKLTPNFTPTSFSSNAFVRSLG